MPINNPDARTWFTLTATSTGEPFALDVDQYPDGSFAFRAELPRHVAFTLTLKSTLPQSVFALFQLDDIIQRARYVNDQWPDHTLVIQTMPDQRADKCKKPGEVNAAEVTARLICKTNFSHFVMYDPHSDVCVNVMRNTVAGSGFRTLTVVSPLECFCRALDTRSVDAPMPGDFIVAVDAGAVARADAVATYFGLGVIYADKDRDLEGRIIGHKIVGVSAGDQPFKHGTGNVWVIDDLVDGGRTFLSIADVLRSAYTFDKLHLYVTHSLQHEAASARLAPHYDSFTALFAY